MLGRILIESKYLIYYNLAIEHAILHNSSINEQSVCSIRFWRNTESCVILGRNQSVDREIDLEYCNNNNIILARRISGGGTVFEDPGTLNISFFLKKSLLPHKNFLENKYFLTEIIMRSLKDSISKNNTNEVFKFRIIDRGSILYTSGGNKFKETKISGSAGYLRKDWYLHHATILISTNLDHLNKSLKARKGKKFYDYSKRNSSNDYLTSNISELKCLNEFKENIVKLSSEMLEIEFIKDDFSKKELSIANNYLKMYNSHKWIYDKERTLF